MHDELINALRCNCQSCKGRKCQDCEYCSQGDYEELNILETMLQAADALERAEAEIAKLREDVAFYEEADTALHGANDATFGEIERLTTRVQELESENQTLNNPHLKRIDSLFAIMIDAIGAKETGEILINSALETEVEKLTTRAEKAEAENAQLTAEIAQLKAEIEVLKSERTQYRQNAVNATENSAVIQPKGIVE